MFKVLCKIWRFIAKLLKMVLDTVVEILGFVLSAIIELAGELWDTVFDSDGLGLKGILFLAGLGLGAWWLMGAAKEEEDKELDRRTVLQAARIQGGQYA